MKMRASLLHYLARRPSRELLLSDAQNRQVFFQIAHKRKPKKTISLKEALMSETVPSVTLLNPLERKSIITKEKLLKNLAETIFIHKAPCLELS